MGSSINILDRQTGKTTATIEIPNDCAVSVGASVQTIERKMWFKGSVPQAVTLIRRPQPNTLTLNFNISKFDFYSVYDAMIEINNAVGKTANIIYCGDDLGNYIFDSGSFTVAIDRSAGIYNCAVSLNATENKVLLPVHTIAQTHFM